MKKLFLVFSLALPLFLHVTSVYGQNTFTDPYVEFKDGKQMQIFDNDKFQVAVTASIMKYTDFNPKELILSFGIVSKASKADVNPQNVSITAYQKNGASSVLEFYPYADYEKRTKKNFILFGAQMNTSTATQETKIDIKDQYGMTQGSVSGKTTTTVTNNDVPSLSEQSEEYLNSTLKRYFRRTTVYPESPYFGDLACKYSKKIERVVVSFKLDGDTYVYDINLNE